MTLKLRSSDWVALGILALVWLVMLVIAWPQGNFPLNDDWSFARVVKALLEEHRLIVTQWSLAAALTHVMFGALFSTVFGFSFEVLRACTLTTAILCTAGVYTLVRKLGFGAAVALISSLSLLVNPIFFELSNTFMSDISFLFLAVWALVVAHDLLRSDTVSPNLHLVALTILCVLLCLSRQTGLVIPIAFFLVCLRKKGKLFALTPLFCSIVGIAVFQVWQDHAFGTTCCYTYETTRMKGIFKGGPAFMGIMFSVNILRAWLYIGLYALPLMLWLFPQFLGRLDKKARIFVALLVAEFGLLAGALCFGTGKLMPLGDDIIMKHGLGPILLRGSDTVPLISDRFWQVVTAFSTIGGALLSAPLAMIAVRWRERHTMFEDNRWSFVAFCLTSCGLYLAVVCLRGFWDRYLLFPTLLLLPVAVLSTRIVLKLDEQPKPLSAYAQRLVQYALASLVLLGFAAFAVIGTHDYFAWNRARWSAITYLLDKVDVRPIDMDGGMEANWWFAYEPNYRDLPGDMWGDLVHDDRFIVSMAPLKQTTVLESFEFQRWLPGGTARIYALKNENFVPQKNLVGTPTKPVSVNIEPASIRKE